MKYHKDAVRSKQRTGLAVKLIVLGLVCVLVNGLYNAVANAMAVVAAL
tara:strand:+ start:1081 stop:1224 length:144 start_codon:yes stop_codon:yes gene_type:complete